MSVAVRCASVVLFLKLSRETQRRQPAPTTRAPARQLLIPRLLTT